MPRGRKARAILGYLATVGDTETTRARLGGILWDRVDDGQARQSFRQALAELARASAAAGIDLILKPSSDSIRLNTSLCQVDAWQLLSPPLENSTIGAHELERIGAARLLEDCEDVSESFDEWLRTERASLEKRIRMRLESDLAAAKESHHLRRRAAERLLCFDPTHERASGELMRALAATDDRVGAMREFERLRAALRARLDAEPSPAIVKLHESLRITATHAVTGATMPPGPPSGGGGASAPMQAAARWDETATGGENFSRRLAAVLAVDVVGYSRLMGLDEEGTHRRVHDFLNGPLRECVEQRGGRVVNTMGDGALAEFSSIVEATRAAQALLAALPALNESQPADRRIQLRIALHVGDIIIEDGEISGEGVNIAARVQSLARPDTICVTEAVVAQIADKFPFEYEDLGPQHLKNIRHKVRVFIVAQRLSAAPDATSLVAASAPVPGFRGRPAIAVLPYSVVGDAPGAGDSYLGEGLAEEVLEQLASWRAFPVIARNSSVLVSGRERDLRAVGAALGAKYLVHGTIRARGGRRLIATQLLDAESGYEVISHRAEDREGGVTGAEFEIARSIVGALEPELLRAERERVSRRSPGNFNAYDFYMRGLWHHYQYSREHNVEALECFRRAIGDDANYAQSRAAMAVSVIYAVQNRWVADEPAALAEAKALSRQAVEIDARDPSARFALGIVSLWQADVAAAVAELTESTALNPSFAAAYAINCHALTFAGDPESGLASGLKALRLSPYDVRHSLWLPGIAAAAYHLGRHEEALGHAWRALTLRPNHAVAVRYAIASLSRLGRASETQALMEQLRVTFPSRSALQDFLKRYHRRQEMIDDLLFAIHSAGF